MKILWAPWRSAFVSGTRESGCIFCINPKSGNDDASMIFARRGTVFGMMNKFPYNTGHILIAPYRHVQEIEGLSTDEWGDMQCLMNDCIRTIKGCMKPDGFNVGFNVGRTSGAGFEHVHMHIVPRWNGDTNFMPAVAGTKVMPESGETTFAKIRDRLKNQ